MVAYTSIYLGESTMDVVKFRPTNWKWMKVREESDDGWNDILVDRVYVPSMVKNTVSFVASCQWMRATCVHLLLPTQCPSRPSQELIYTALQEPHGPRSRRGRKRSSLVLICQHTRTAHPFPFPPSLEHRRPPMLSYAPLVQWQKRIHTSEYPPTILALLYVL